MLGIYIFIMVLTILIAFVSLIGLIILHEFGHFIVAKRFGVKVEEFGIFLPPRLIGKKIGETIYSLNLLPFGAFVRLYGETEDKSEYWSFTQKPVWQRVLIVIAGVISFWLVSAILLSIVMGFGAPTAISDEENGNLIDPKVQIAAVAPNSPAEMAGLRVGDTIKQLSVISYQLSVNKVKEVQEFTEKYKDQKIVLTIERGKEIFEVSLVPRVSPPEGEGPMGVALVRTAIKSWPWYQAPFKGIEQTFQLTLAIIEGLFKVGKNLVLEGSLPPGVQLMGPIGIGALMTQFAQLGIIHYLNFIAVISIYFAIFNLLPIPALDGGKLVFLGIEAVRKKPVSSKTEQRITSFFFVLLIALIIWVTIKDIARLF